MCSQIKKKVSIVLSFLTDYHKSMEQNIKNENACQTIKVHPNIVSRVLDTTPEDEFLYDLAVFLKFLEIRHA